MDIAFDDRDNRKILQSDYILNIGLKSANVFNTKKVNFCYEEGYRIAKEQMEEIKQALDLN